jgi:hypothetical protein
MSLIQRLHWVLLIVRLITVFGAIADSHRQRLGPEIRFQDIVDDAVQILDRAAMLRDMAKRFVARHFGIARAPERFRFWVQPDHRFRPIMDNPHEIGARVGIVRSSIAQNNYRGSPINSVQVVLRKVFQ